MEQSFTYNMSSKLLPVNVFTTMDKAQIMGRMSCTEDLDLRACMDYCDMYRHTYPYIYTSKWECLKIYLKVPPKYWAEDMCANDPYKPDIDANGKITKQSRYQCLEKHFTM